VLPFPFCAIGLVLWGVVLSVVVLLVGMLLFWKWKVCKKRILILKGKREFLSCNKYHAVWSSSICQLGTQISQNFVEGTGEENVYYCLLKEGQIRVLSKLFTQRVGEHVRKIEAAVDLWRKILQAGWGKGKQWFLLSAQTLILDDT